MITRIAQKKVQLLIMRDFHLPCGLSVDYPVEIQGGSYRSGPSIKLPKLGAPNRVADSVS